MSCSNHYALSALSAPSPDTVEVLVVGPRYGEAICVHLGDNRWVTVDSCLHGRGEKPAALHYLESIGVRSDAIELICVTHWHDDHVRGLSSLVRASPNATVVIPEALGQREFMLLAARYGEGRLSSGVRELRNIYVMDPPPQLKLAGADKRLMKGATSAGDFEVWALSPSSAEVIQAIQSLGKLVPREGDPMGNVKAQTPNHLAMVILINVGNYSVLLGADLEQVTSAAHGWNGVLTTTVAQAGASCSLFKVPHHGSVTGYNAAVWQQLVSQDAVAVLTPFHRGRCRVPSPAEAQVVAGHTSNAFITAKNPLIRPKVKKPAIVEKEIEDVTEDGLHIERPEPGAIRCRSVIVGGLSCWEVGLINGATPL